MVYLYVYASYSNIYEREWSVALLCDIMFFSIVRGKGATTTHEFYFFL